MDVTSAKQVFSSERLATYERLASKYQKDPMELYLLNAQISGTFHFPLDVCEIAFRNTIDKALSIQFNDDWHKNGAFRNMLDAYQRNKLNEGNKKNQDKKNKVIADLNLGFWVNLLSENFSYVWNTNLYSCFPNYKSLNPLSQNPKNAQKKIHRSTMDIKNFRNRIAHYEPILGRDLHKTFEQIVNIIKYIDIETADWVNDNSSTLHYIDLLQK